MVRRLLLAMVIVIPLVWVPAIAAGQAATSASVDEETKLTQEEITMLMIQVGRLPAVQQNRKMEMVWDHLESSETPRSDFLFCTGFAYLGNYKAQACLGNAFEKGRGTEKDLADAYVWYAIACDNPIDDPEVRQKIREDRDRTKKALLTGYPSKSARDLEDLVKLQKAFRMQCLAEVRNEGF